MRHETDDRDQFMINNIHITALRNRANLIGGDVGSALRGDVEDRNALLIALEDLADIGEREDLVMLLAPLQCELIRL